MPSVHLIRDVKTRRVPQTVLVSPRLGAYLMAQATDVATIYRGIVAKRTGRLAASAAPSVAIGGHKHDRLIGKVTVGTGVPHAAVHEFGAPHNPERQGAHELREALTMWKARKNG